MTLSNIVRLDLTFASVSSAAIADSPTAEGTTQHQATADVLRVLVASGYSEKHPPRTQLVLAMISLASPLDRNLRARVA